MDDRPQLAGTLPEGFVRSEKKPAMVGGAAGWITYFMLLGQSLDQAIISTKQLYQNMGWGVMEIHIDDEHGHISDPNELSNRTQGCGFLSVVKDVAQIVSELLKEQISGLSINQFQNVSGTNIFEELKKAGAKVVPLTGEHADNASVIINQKQGRKTLDRNQLFSEYPAFLWDQWATANNNVLRAFNKVAGVSIDLDQFTRLQTAVHLVTALRLGALKQDFSNLAIIQG